MRATAWGLGLALVFLHIDPFRFREASLAAGWLPAELVYRLVWMLLAWLYLLWFLSRVWKDEP